MTSPNSNRPWPPRRPFSSAVGSRIGRLHVTCPELRPDAVEPSESQVRMQPGDGLVDVDVRHAYFFSWLGGVLRSVQSLSPNFSHARPVAVSSRYSSPPP